jgi:hypothetical protein
VGLANGSEIGLNPVRFSTHDRNENPIHKFERSVVLTVKVKDSFSTAKDNLYRWDDGRWGALESDERVSRGIVQGKTSILGTFGVGR